ncbi:MAG: hypothetical protein A3J83_04255 [Elusimicrobia bacterium RIFOXYA2_FULL_40_6]|nr:MAG: hypothetical protein A3J83_04255 [Elusimicrobia bacterium RIFOXYA2_FULL_40_6]
MNKVFILISILLFYCPGAYAENADNGLPGYFLNLGLGARALGMGRAFVAVADDSSAVYWNPARLTKLNKIQAAVSHLMLFEDTSYDSLSFAKNMNDNLSFGMGYMQLVCGNIPVKDENNSGDTTTSQYDGALLLSSAYKYRNSISFGITAKTVYKSFYDVSRTWHGIDLAASYSPTERLDFGLNLQNFVYFGYIENYEIPGALKAGVSYKMLNKDITIALDANKTSGQSYKLNAGMELKTSGNLIVRGGFEEENPSIGFTAIIKNINIDYALLSHQLGLSSRITLAYHFGNQLASKIIEHSEAMNIKKEKIPDYEIEVQAMKEIPTAVYHLFKDKNISVVTLQVKNNSKKEAKFIIKYGIGAEKHQEIKETIVRPMEKISINLTPMLTTDEIKKIQTVPTPDNIFVEVDKILGDKTRPVFKQFCPITLLPYDQFSPQVTDAKNETFDMVETLASWITYNDRNLCEILSKASDKGALLNPPVKIIGFQSPNVFTSRPVDNRSLEEKEKDYRQQIKLLYDTLKDDYKLTYLNQPVAYGETQRIKLPYSVLSNKGNCVELAILFASLLESIEIDPIIAIFPEEKHATVGYKVYGDGKDKCILLETNVFGEDFERVFAKGRELVERYNLKTEFDDIVPFDEKGLYKKGTGVIIFDVKKIRNRIPPSPYIPH